MWSWFLQWASVTAQVRGCDISLILWCMYVCILCVPGRGEEANQQEKDWKAWDIIKYPPETTIIKWRRGAHRCRQLSTSTVWKQNKKLRLSQNQLLRSKRVAEQTGVGMALFSAFSGFWLSHRKEIRFCSREAWVNLKSQYQHLDYWCSIV